MPMKTYPQLTFADIQKINYNIVADRVRDKGKGNSNDYMSITLGILFFKRVLDMRAEFKSRFATSGTEENAIYLLNDSNIDNSLLNHNSKFPEFSVKSDKFETYRIQWDDIINFPDNPNKNELKIDYADGLGGNKLVSTAANKAELVKDCLDAFAHHRIHDFFDTVNFIPKVYGSGKTQVLDFPVFEEILNDLGQYSFGIAYASQDLFADAYMDLLAKFAAGAGKKGGEFFTPTNVVKGAARFLNLMFKNRKIVVADPTAGACTFMVQFAELYKKEFNKTFSDKAANFNDFIEVATQEKDPITKSLGDVNMLLHGFSSNHKSYHANTITEYLANIGLHKGTIDYILANPPYGGEDYGYDYAIANKQKESRWDMGVPNKGDKEMAFVSTILDLLSDEGKAVVVLPLGVLFRDSAASFREKIIGKDWLEGVILLPGKMFLTTDIPVCLWILNKKKEVKDQDKVFMVNASLDFIKKGKFNDWDFEKSVEKYINREAVADYCGYIDNSVVKKNKYNLSTQRYFAKVKVKEEIDIVASYKKIAELKRKIEGQMKFDDEIFCQILKMENTNENK